MRVQKLLPNLSEGRHELFWLLVLCGLIHYFALEQISNLMQGSYQSPDIGHRLV